MRLLWELVEVDATFAKSGGGGDDEDAESTGVAAFTGRAASFLV